MIEITRRLLCVVGKAQDEKKKTITAADLEYRSLGNQQRCGWVGVKQRDDKCSCKASIVAGFMNLIICRTTQTEGYSNGFHLDLNTFVCLIDLFRP